MPDTEERKQAINHKAIALLAVQERSRFILRRKLQERFKEPGDKELIEECLDLLEEKNYLSDRRYARAVIELKSYRFGDLKLIWSLRQQGIADNIIKEEMKAIQGTEYDRAKALWERQFGEPPADRKEKERQIRYLSSRGFSFSTVCKVIKGNNKGYF